MNIMRVPEHDMTFKEFQSFCGGTYMCFDRIIDGFKRYFGCPRYVHPHVDFSVFLCNKIPEPLHPTIKDAVLCGYQFDDEFKWFEKCKECNLFECENAPYGNNIRI